MAVGAGKYDALCTYVREQADAEIAVVIVIGGKTGSGFSVQSTFGDVHTLLPGLLRATAHDIEESASKQREGGGDEPK